MRAAERPRPNNYMSAPMYLKKQALYPFTINEVINMVSVYLKVPVEQIKAKGRQKERVFARHVISYICTKALQPAYSSVSITRHLPLDHAGILHGKRVCTNFLSIPCDQKKIIESIIEKFTPTTN